MSFTNIVFCNVLNLRVSCPDEILIFSHGNGPDFRCRNRRHSFGQFPSVFHSNCESLSISSVVRSLSLSLLLVCSLFLLRLLALASELVSGALDFLAFQL